MLKQKHFEDWFNKLKNVWERRDPEGAISLCADKFLWYETPFAKPYSTKEEIFKEWQGVLNQEDVSVSFEILSENGNMGIAHWHATFTRLPSKTKATLDEIFQVTFNDHGECTKFRQWYNSKD